MDESVASIVLRKNQTSVSVTFVPGVRILDLGQPTLPLAGKIDALGQGRDVMGQGVVGVHLHGSVARQRHVEISRHGVSTWDWAVGNPTNYSTEPSTD